MATVCELLGIKYPIFCGAMARISTHPLVAAVSEGGGLGIIASGGMTAEELRMEIDKVRQLTNKPFGVNLMLMMPNCDELVEVIIAKKVALVTTGAGNPAKYIPRLKAAGVKVFPVIASLKHAHKMIEAGADGVVAEGQEAGGHIGQTSTMSLLPQIVDAVDIPVIGAGGVGDGRSVAAMFALGAQGVQVGTAFLVAEECPIHDRYKAAVIAANDTDTIVTGRTLMDPVRALNNPMLTTFLEMEYHQAGKEDLLALTNGALSRAVYDGDMETGSPMCGEVAGMIKAIKPAKEIIENLFKEADQVASQLKISR